MFCAICYHLYSLKIVKNTHGGGLLLEPATLLKVTLLHGCFSRFFNFTDGIKLRNASHIFFQVIAAKIQIMLFQFPLTFLLA